jgi:hypothetical protein
MFDYDKVIKKLKNFDELSGKKQQKIFSKIIVIGSLDRMRIILNQ